MTLQWTGDIKDSSLTHLFSMFKYPSKGLKKCPCLYSFRNLVIQFGNKFYLQRLKYEHYLHVKIELTFFSLTESNF